MWRVPIHDRLNRWFGHGGVVLDLCAHSQHTGRQQRAQVESHSLTLQLHPISECPACPRCVHAQPSAPLHHGCRTSSSPDHTLSRMRWGGAARGEAQPGRQRSVHQHEPRSTDAPPKPHLASTKCKPAYAQACQKQNHGVRTLPVGAVITQASALPHPTLAARATHPSKASPSVSASLSTAQADAHAVCIGTCLSPS